MSAREVDFIWLIGTAHQDYSPLKKFVEEIYTFPTVLIVAAD